MTTDWEGEKYCGLTLEWDYIKRKVHLSIPGYIDNALNRFNHMQPKQLQNHPHKHAPPNYGAKVQYARPEDKSPPSAAMTKLSFNRSWEFFCSPKEQWTAHC